MGGRAVATAGRVARPRVSGFLFWLGLAACTGAAVLIRGYGFGLDDQALYLPFLYHWNTPTLFPHDYLLTMGLAKESLTWPVLALLGRWTGFPPLFLILYLLSTFWGLYFLYRTAELLWKNARAAWISVFLWLPAFDVPGTGINTFDGYFTTRCLGIVLAAAALYYFLKQRSTLYLLALSLGVFVHVIDVFPIAAGIGLALLLERRWGDWAKLTLVLGIAGTCLVIYTRILGVRHDLWALYTGARFESLWRWLPDLFPQGQPASARTAVALYLGATGLAFLVHWVKGSMDKAERRLLGVVLGVVVMAVLGALGALAGIALLAQLSLTRGLLWALYALALWFGKEIAKCLSHGKAWSTALGLFLIAALLMGSAQPLALAVAILSALAYVRSEEAGTGRVSPALAAWLAALAVLTLMVLEALWMVRLPKLGLNWSANALPATILLMGLAALFTVALRDPAALAKPWVLGSCLGLALMLCPSYFMMTLCACRPPLASVIPGVEVGYEAARRSEAWKASLEGMADLVRRSVPADATVIVPPQWRTFRLQSQRSSFVTFKDFCGCAYDEGFYREWTRRAGLIGAIRPGIWTLNGALEAPEARWVSLAQAYRGINLDFIVTMKPLNFPEVGRVDGLILYKIPLP